MGLIRIPRKTTERSVIFDFASVQENQTLLSHHLNDLLRYNPRQDHQDTIDPETLHSLRNFTHLDVSAPFLDFDQILSIYTQQYHLVGRALAIGDENRRRSRETSRLNDPSALVFHADANENRFQAIVGISNRRMSPSALLTEFQRIRSICKIGDLIDIAGYRGTGYYFVISNDSHTGNIYKTNTNMEDFDLGFRAIKTGGQYGCYLPSDAWPLIQQFGFEYFELADVWACYLPRDAEIVIKNGDQRISFPLQSEDSYLVSWLQGGDEIEVNGDIYNCEVMRSRE